MVKRNTRSKNNKTVSISSQKVFVNYFDEINQFKICFSNLITIYNNPPKNVRPQDKAPEFLSLILMLVLGVVENGHMVGVGLVWVLHTPYS